MSMRFIPHKNWRKPLMANIMRSQAVHQQPHVQGGPIKQPISNPMSMRFIPHKKPGADL